MKYLYNDLINVFHDIIKYIIENKLVNSNNNLFKLTNEQLEEFKQILKYNKYQFTKISYSGSTFCIRFHINSNYEICIIENILFIEYIDKIIYRFSCQLYKEPNIFHHYINDSILYKFKNNKIIDISNYNQSLFLNLDFVTINYLINK
uniref:Uncharacterized protein n=1 Tax=Pithovirus LCDPAC02 TaxID=2506601 RepID=A0A481YRA4_9VIRU|nr:MAG: hypothetical protein LCDPAC02_02030 [Pithovirus LCDPAC02]